MPPLVETDSQPIKREEFDVGDERVKDRWSRYIGAMGLEAVAKQATANVCVVGLGALGIEVAKNITLAGCRELIVIDDLLVSSDDLAG